MALEIEIKEGDIGQMIVMCSFCNAIRKNDDSWFHIEDDPYVWYKLANEYHDLKNKKLVSHTYCNPCRDEYIKKELEQLKSIQSSQTSHYQK